MTAAISTAARSRSFSSASSSSRTLFAVEVMDWRLWWTCPRSSRQCSHRTAALNTARASTSSTEYQTVRRVRSESCTAVPLYQLIALSAPRANQGRPFGVVELPAEPLDVDVDDVRKRVVVLVPDVLGDVGAAHDVASAAREVFEERVLTARQRHFPALRPDALARNVDGKGTDRKAIGGQRTPVAAGGGAGGAPGAPAGAPAPWGRMR